MDFLIDHWGSLASVIGVLVSVVGLGWVVIVARGARSAAQAAQKATDEARDNIRRNLQLMDLERSIALIERIKLLHSIGRWESASELYPVLRAMISAIIARISEKEIDLRQRLAMSRTSIVTMQEYIESHANRELETDHRQRINRELNTLQVELEDIASTMGLGN